MAYVACALGCERIAVLHGLLFVLVASEHMYYITNIRAVCFSEGLDILGVSSWDQKVCRAMRESCIAVGIFCAYTARNIVIVLGRTLLGAYTVGSV